MQFHNDKDKILIVDFGSQVTKLIARRIRELGVYSEIIKPSELAKLKKYQNIKGVILSGGPSTVTVTKTVYFFLVFFLSKLRFLNL